MKIIARPRPEVHTDSQIDTDEAPDQVGMPQPGEFRSFAALDDELMRRTDVTATAKLILARLPKWARSQDACFPAIETIARAIGASKSTVRTSLKVLERLGLIRVDRTMSNPTGRVLVLCYNRPGVRRPAEGMDPPVRVQNLRGVRVQNLRGGGSKICTPLDRSEESHKRLIDRFAAPVEEGSLEVGEGAGVLPPIQAAAPEAIALFTALEVVQAVSGAAPATVAPPLAVPPAPAPSKSPAAPEAPAAARSAEERAWAVWSDLYAGFDAAPAAADWRQWWQLYLTVISRIDARELTQDQVAEAIRFARGRNDHITRGRRFMSSVNSLAAGDSLPTGKKPTHDNERPTPGPPRMSPADAARAVARYGNRNGQTVPHPAPDDANGGEPFEFPDTAAGIMAYSRSRQNPEGPLSEAGARFVSRLSAPVAVGGAS